MVVAPRSRTVLMAVAICLASALAAALLTAGGAAQAQPNRGGGVPEIDWGQCESQTAQQNGFECATVVVPKDYGSPNAGNLRLAVTRRPADDQENRIGPLFINYGGPGGAAVSTTQRVAPTLLSAYTERFDIVAIDPRGVGESTPAIDCKADQREEGIYSIPSTDPENFNRSEFKSKVDGYVGKCVRNNRKILPYTSTANVARDMNYVRRGMGDQQINYLGFSYGTFLGATYVSMFPDRYRTAVLDGALDAKDYLTRPMAGLREQTGGFERALGRYFEACQANTDYCSWVENDDPSGTYDKLVESADENPIPVADPTQTAGDTTPVTGDDINNGALGTLYAKQAWPSLTTALYRASQGDGTQFRTLSNGQLGVVPDGPDSPSLDRYFAIGAAEQRYGGDLDKYIRAGESSWETFDHFWSNSGYVEWNYAKFPIDGRDVYRGPFDVPASAETPLVVGTTYDPATVYRASKSLTRDLGNARLLTMDGDGHTAYGGNSPCIDEAVNAYVIEGTLPEEGTVCQQQVAFPPAPTSGGLRPQGVDSAIERAKLEALEQARPAGG